MLEACILEERFVLVERQEQASVEEVLEACMLEERFVLVERPEQASSAFVVASVGMEVTSAAAFDNWR